MNILSIGNSFSQDAQRYIHKIARADGVDLNTHNLYIGGCSLERHHRNMLSGEREYELELNGVGTGFYVSLDEALLNRAWDVITVQQVSTGSMDYDTYQPYLNRLVEYIRECVPKAKVVIHQTWACEEGSERLHGLGYEKQIDYHNELKKAYDKAAKDIKADFIIPSGELFQKLISAGISPVHRDTFHASYGTARYAMGLLWYSMLTGRDITNNTFSDFDEPVTDEEIAKIKACVKELTK
ncbi:MAG: DUF4886 domain-containing protein [Clostridia bacterium]|nr:DUF4886 domain-containing protein [Clostridia bacterium]